MMDRKIVAIDYGKKRIGLASAHLNLGISTPLCTILTGKSHMSTIEVLLSTLEKEGIIADSFVLGLPLMLNGSEGPMVQIVRQFGNILQDKAATNVHYFDERLSSAGVESVMKRASVKATKRKELSDQLAATVLLQAFIERNLGAKNAFATLH